MIDLPKLIQQLIIRGIILPFRAPKTRKAYKTIWGESGSPLIDNTQKIANSLSERMGWNVRIAMRYQYPSIKESMIKSNDDGEAKLSSLDGIYLE